MAAVLAFISTELTRAVVADPAEVIFPVHAYEIGGDSAFH